MNFREPKSSVISRLRIRGNRLDSTACRLHFDRLLASAELAPASLSPSAILCIKTLRDPSPGKLRLRRNETRLPNVWQHAVVGEIDRLASRARRPAREASVSSEAESVIFADYAELLACLASDWCDELLGARWWWKSLFPDRDVAREVVRIWLENTRFAPVAIGLLANQKKAVNFARKLQPEQAKNLLQNILAEFGLAALQTALFQPQMAEDFGKSFIRPALPKSLAFKNFLKEFEISAPWDEFATETKDLALTFETQCLLGIGLTLIRAPRIVRSAEFARKVSAWRDEQIALIQNPILSKKRKTSELLKISAESISPEAESVIQFPQKNEKTSENPSLEIFETERKTREKLHPIEYSEKPFQKPDSTDFSSLPAQNPPLPASDKPPAASSGEKSGAKIEEKQEILTERSSQKERQRDSVLFQPEEQFSETPEVAMPVELSVETGCGGVFYLINAALFLNLYSDFTSPLEPGLELDIWDFVALAGCEFLGERFTDDGAWSLLALLAGRDPHESPGCAFSPPADWLLPPDWLKTFEANEKWCWQSDGKRLIVYHPAGFCVADVSLTDFSKTQWLAKISADYGINALMVEDASLAGAKNFDAALSPLARWLFNLTGYLRTRLKQALNLETASEINKVLFERRARVIATAARLDVTFFLADLPIAVRLSGLDRNPGWVPAAGRTIEFHFI